MTDKITQAYKEIHQIISKYGLSAREILTIANDMKTNSTIALTIATISELNEEDKKHKKQ